MGERQLNYVLRKRHFIRTPEEILERIYEARDRGDEGDEIHEYMKQVRFIPLFLREAYEDTKREDWIKPESIVNISRTAERFLTHFEGACERGNARRIEMCINFYRAWKWLLGHDDADTFDKYAGAPVQVLNWCVYREIERQINSREWHEKTRQAQHTKGM